MKPLRSVLRLNTATCLLFGILFLVAPESVAAFLGAVPVLAVLIIGGALLFNGIHLAIASLRKNLWPAEVLYFATGDFLWFGASVLTLASGVFITTWPGILATLVVAIVVAGIGLRQCWSLAEHIQSGMPKAGDRNAVWYMPADQSRGKAILTSWLAIKPWVKIWLFLLNGVFLMGLFFWPETLVRFSMAAFVSSGPLLFALMIMQRGLSRLLGVAHLIPWVPLLAYLGLQLSGPTLVAGSGLFWYTCLLFAAVAVCLAFDIHDVVRWAKGRRGRLGSPSESQAAWSGPTGPYLVDKSAKNSKPSHSPLT